jgi:hypothetical protein
MIFIIYFMLIEIRLCLRLKKKYVLRFWSLIQWGIIISLWLSIAFYIQRYREYHRIGK